LEASWDLDDSKRQLKAREGGLGRELEGERARTRAGKAVERQRGRSGGEQRERTGGICDQERA
jgi:hypothetical protein